MAQGLVVGIFPGSDPAAIEGALSGQQIDLTKVKVFRKGSASSSEEADSWSIDFVDVAENMDSNSLSDDMTKGMGIMGDSGGTGVPGVGGRGPSLGSFSSGGGNVSYLGSLPIPADEADNFNSAVAEGRAVVAYPDAGDTAASVVDKFRAAGLKNVRSY